MKQIRILLAVGVAAVGIVGCSAQEGAKALGPGLPPQAFPDVVVVEINTLNNLLAPLGNDIDRSGTGLTITDVQVDQVVPPTAGALASTNGSTVSFTPPPNFTGVVTLLYSIADGTGAVSSAAIAVSVLPVALPPVALPDVVTVVQDSGATDIDVLANDIDLAGGGLTLTGFTVTAELPPAAHNIAVVGNQVQFTPAATTVGAVVMNYTITDVNGATAVGLLTIVVSPLDVPIGPVPVPDAAVVTQDSGATDIDVLANDVDPAAGGLTVTGVAVTASLPNAVHAVSVVGNQVRFTPAAGFAGSVIVTYTATDVDGNSADGVLSVVVSPIDLAIGPVALPDVVLVAQDSGANDVDVLANDVDTAAGGLTVTAVSVTVSVPTATHAVAIVGNKVRFTPQAGFAGAVVVSYTATDVNGDTSDGVLSIEVTPSALEIPPVALPDTGNVSSVGGAQSFNVLANDIDPAAGGLTLTNVSLVGVPPLNAGSVSIVTNQVRYTPVVAYAGVVTVTYTAADINGNTTTSTLILVVTP